MNIEYILGVIVGILFAILLIAVIGWFAKKVGGKLDLSFRNNKKNFDERQQLIRGKAYKYGFFTLILFLIIKFALEKVLDTMLFSSFAGNWIGICLSIAVFAIVCVWNDAYISLNENMKGVIILFIGVALLNIGSSFLNLYNGHVSFLETMQVVKNGEIFDYSVISVECVNLTCGILFLVICIAIALKSIVDRKEEDFEDDDAE